MPTPTLIAVLGQTDPWTVRAARAGVAPGTAAHPLLAANPAAMAAAPRCVAATNSLPAVFTGRGSVPHGDTGRITLAETVPGGPRPARTTPPRRNSPRLGGATDQPTTSPAHQPARADGLPGLRSGGVAGARAQARDRWSCELCGGFHPSGSCRFLGGCRICGAIFVGDHCANRGWWR